MWLLKKNDDGTLIYLKPGAPMTVGRSKGDIVLSGDTSVSRVHAQITVEPVLNHSQITENTQPLSKCTVKDPGSMYGTYIMEGGNATRIDNGYELKHMDCIRFGLQKHIFTVQYVPIITATSGMGEAENEELKMMLETIDGNFIYFWSPLSTHMTIGDPIINEKLICALASQKLMVPVHYWDYVAKAFEENRELPDPTTFASSIECRMSQLGNISLSPNPARQTLFSNLIFLHFNSKQFATYARMIRLAGGMSLQCGKQPVNVDVTNDNVIVVTHVESNTTQAMYFGNDRYAAICQKLSECRRRTIPETEILLAILHCSIQKYCNVKSDRATLFASSAAENATENTNVLALETQDLDLPSTSTRVDHDIRNLSAKQPIAESTRCIPESIEGFCVVEPRATVKCHKNVASDLPERSSDRSEAAASETATNSLPEDFPSESEVGSTKLASFDREKYTKAKCRKGASIEETPAKRGREKEDEKYSEAKKVCLGISSVSKESGASESDLPYVELISDDEDAFFVDEHVSSAEEVPVRQERKKGKRQEVGKLVRSLSPEEVLEVLEDVDEPKKRRRTDVDDPCVNNVVLPSTSAAFSSRTCKASRAWVFEIEEEITENKPIADTDKISRKRKSGRSDTSPVSDIVVNPFSRNKLESAINRRSDKFRRKAMKMKRAHMDSPPPTPKQPKELSVNKECGWLSSTAVDFAGSEKDDSAASDESKRHSAHDDTSRFLKFPNDKSLETLPILRIRNLDDLDNKNRPKFGKCFRKQKVKIPTRIELDGSVYKSTSIRKENWKPSPRSEDEEGLDCVQENIAGELSQDDEY